MAMRVMQLAFMVGFVAALVVAAEVQECEGEDNETASLLQVRRDRQLTPSNTPNCKCAWIPQDDCKGRDSCAQECRKANPWGPCGGGQTPQNAGNCDCAWIPGDDCKAADSCAQECRKANPWGPCGGGQTPQNAGNCNCAWIPGDDCKGADWCARECRKANPWGPCGYSKDAAEVEWCLTEACRGCQGQRGDLAEGGCWLCSHEEKNLRKCCVDAHPSVSKCNLYR